MHCCIFFVTRTTGRVIRWAGPKVVIGSFIALYLDATREAIPYTGRYTIHAA